MTLNSLMSLPRVLAATAHLRCDVNRYLEACANEGGLQIPEEGRQRDIQYDAAVLHGRTQGAWTP